MATSKTAQKTDDRPAPDALASTTDHPEDLTVVQALNSAMGLIGAVGKGEFNKHAGFNFRGVDAVVNAASPAFRRCGIVVTPEVLDVTRESTTTRSGAVMMNVYVIVKYTFYGPKGDSISATVAAESFDSGDKATAKAMSVAFRIALLQTLALPTMDEDPDHAIYERGAAPQAADQAPQDQPQAVEVHPDVQALADRWATYTPQVIGLIQSLWSQFPGVPHDGPQGTTPANAAAVAAVFDRAEQMAAEQGQPQG